LNFLHGETTITLEDVIVQLGLPIDDEVETIVTIVEEVFMAFHKHLGIVPPTIAMKGNLVKVS